MSRRREKLLSGAEGQRALANRRLRTQYPVVGAKKQRSLRAYERLLAVREQERTGRPGPRPAWSQGAKKQGSKERRERAWRKLCEQGWTDTRDDPLLGGWTRVLAACLPPKTHAKQRYERWFFRSPVDGVSLKELCGVATYLLQTGCKRVRSFGVYYPVYTEGQRREVLRGLLALTREELEARLVLAHVAGDAPA